MTYTRIDDGTPWLLLRSAAAHTPARGDAALLEVVRSLCSAGIRPLFRGVPIDRYPTIAASGVDTPDPGSAIFCADDFEKALEYTRAPFSSCAGAVMVFRGDHLDRCWRELPADSDAGVIAETLRDYPHRVDGTDTVWFSRIAHTDPATGYERQYGYWIPGDPHAALAAVILVGDVHVPFDYSPPGQPAQVWSPPPHWPE